MLPQLYAGLAALLLVAAGAGRATAQQNSARLVTFGAAVTETVAALGATDRLVGIDRSSELPAGAGRITVLDYFRAISVEGVISLRPSLVLAGHGSGPPTALVQLQQAGVPLVQLPSPESLTGAVTQIRQIGAALGLASRADSLARQLERRATAHRKTARRAPIAPRVLAIYARGAGTLFVAGKGTGLDMMVQLANGRNAAASMEGYKALTAEAVIAAAPEVLVVPARGLASIGGLNGLRRLPGIAQTPAARNNRIVVIDDHLLLGFGPRLDEGLRQLAAGLHPALAADFAAR